MIICTGYKTDMIEHFLKMKNNFGIKIKGIGFYSQKVKSICYSFSIRIAKRVKLAKRVRTNSMILIDMIDEYKEKPPFQ